jgi:hypothetical protein
MNAGGYRRLCVATGGVLLGMAAAAGWAQQEPGAIGIVTAVRGEVSVQRKGAPAPARLAVRHPLHAEDAIGTDPQAKVKALLQDDTMLALGRSTGMTIEEYLHAPEQQIRRMTVRLERGTMRTLVGRAFSGLGSTFVVRAGTASIIANAAYCVVWHREEETGVANIGTGGAVSFVAGGRVVILEPGSYSIAQAGKQPSAAQPVDAKAPPAVRQAVGDLAEQEIEEELRACPPGSPPGGICPRKPPSPALSPATPPAVTSGATRR